MITNRFAARAMIVAALFCGAGVAGLGEAPADAAPADANQSPAKVDPGGDKKDAVKKSTWNGYEQLSFTVGGRAALLVVPDSPAKGKPWIWRTEFFGHEPQADIELLNKGFHVAYVNVQNMYGAPAALDAMDAFYAHVTEAYGLSPKTTLEGFSRGGLFAYNWAARHPDRVASLYVDAPVCDFKSWPGGKGKSAGSKGDWQRCLAIYGLTEEQALAYKLNPVDNLEPLAKAHIPILSVVGEADKTVPIAENTSIVEQRYKQLGGTITVIAKPFCDHHPHSLRDPTAIVNFVLASVGMSEAAIDRHAVPNGHDYISLRGGLNKCRAKFEHEKVGRVVFLGAAIATKPSWREMVCEDLQQRFPQTRFEFLTAGDGLGKGPADLVLVQDAGQLRQARSAMAAADIVALGGADSEAIARELNISSIDLASESADRVRAGEFASEQPLKEGRAAALDARLYAHSVERLFDAMWKDPLAPGDGKR